MNSRIVFADALRGLAALSVVIAHYVLAFWVPGPVIPQISNTPPLLPGTMPTLTAWILSTPSRVNFAAFGVSLFFAISGFVIPLSLNRLGAIAFLRARFWRIVPTYLAGFSVTLAALWIASTVYGQAFPYSLRETTMHAVPGVRYLAGTRFIDFVVWTLEIEVLFYLLCAVMAPLLQRGSLWTIAVPTALLALAWRQPAGIDKIYLQDLAFMFIGVALSFDYHKQLPRWLAWPAAATIVAASLASIGFSQGWSVAENYGYAGAVFALAYVLRDYFPDLAPLRWLAAISYPLYVVHGIAGYVGMRLMISAGLSPGAALFLALVGAGAVSAALHFGVEVPTQRIGKRPFSLNGWIVRSWAAASPRQ